MALGIGAAGWGTITSSLAAASGAAQGIQQNRSQRRARADQNRAQAQVRAQAASQQRQDAMQMNAEKARVRTFDDYIAEERQRIENGITSTMLTGPNGVDPLRLRLGRNKLFGQG